MGFISTGLAELGSWVAGSTAAAGTAGAAAGASTAAIEAGGYAAVGGGIAAGGAAGGAAAAGIGTTIAEASAIATGASALYTLSQGAGRINVPPVPVNQPQVDQSVANAQQQQLQRMQAAGGLQSTVGPGMSQGGAVLNPTTLSQRSLLGA